MSIFILLAILVGLIVLLILWVKHCIFIKNLIASFSSCNVIVAGKKGTGKDALMQFVVNKRDDDYYSNISYGGKYHNVKLKDVSCAPNDYFKIVNDKIDPQPHKFIENKDIYISDIGIFLPSYMDSTLYKLFPSMPIEYALSRHLYNHNIHCNTQNIERGWKALREQADYYCICKGTFKIFGFLITKVITYDKYESAKKGLLPIKSRMFNKYSKAQIDLYYAENGEITQGHIIQRIKNIKYDTRAFEKILLTGDRIEN